MNEFNRAKADYASIPIPEELDGVVRGAIRKGRKRRLMRSFKRNGMAAAACFALLVGVLNLSPSAAAAAAEVPILSGLFRILTVRNFEQTENGIDYHVSVPEIQADGALAQQVNAAIQTEVDAHLARARRDWDEYKKAFFETGGSEAEWNDREMDVIIDYEIKSQSDTRVSFVVSLAECWVAAQEERYYYNLDLADNRPVTLQMLLGDDWVERCNQAVRSGIAERTDPDGTSMFFAPEEGGFTTVDENTAFYIREDGVPVLAFPKYEIAAGAAGVPEFPVD